MRVLAILPAMTLAACASTAQLGSASDAFFSPEQGLPKPFPKGLTFESPAELAYFNSGGYSPGDGEGQNTLHIQMRPAEMPGALDILITAEGFADDSVAGRQSRIIAIEENGRWRPVRGWARNKCYRGANPGQWQKWLCP